MVFTELVKENQQLVEVNQRLRTLMGRLSSKKILERLAALEHEQWAHWMEYMFGNLTPENVARWRKQMETPYADLSEKEKESDRKWARKIIKALLTDLEKEGLGGKEGE